MLLHLPHKELLLCCSGTKVVIPHPQLHTCPWPRALAAPCTPVFQTPTLTVLCAADHKSAAALHVPAPQALEPLLLWAIHCPVPQSPLQVHVLQSPALWLLHICTHLRHRANITAGKLVPYILELLLLHECPCSRYQICPHSIGTHASDISVTTTVRAPASQT